MREYVLFVILIFIPIGLVLYYFLRREGLPKKDISVILLLALLTIFSFPICMERLGIYLSLLIYLLIIGALVAYLLRSGEGPYLETAFASLRNLRQGSGLIIKTEQDLTVLNYEQLSEIPIDKLESAAEQVADTLPPVIEEDIEHAAAIDIVEDLASEPEALLIEAQVAQEVTGKAQEKVMDNTDSAVKETSLGGPAGEAEKSLDEQSETIQFPEAVPDGLVGKMVARLAAEIEAIPETLPQTRDIEVLAEEQAELAVVVEIVKDVIVEAAVRIETATAGEIFGEAAGQDKPKTLKIPEPAAAEDETTVPAEEAEAAPDIEIAEDIGDESIVQVEAAPEEIVEESAAKAVSEVTAVPEPAAAEDETTVPAEEAGAAADIEIAEDIGDESIVQVEAAPEEIIEESAAEAVSEVTVVPEPVADEDETTVPAEEAEVAADIEIAEDIAEESVAHLEAAPIEEIVENTVAEEKILEASEPVDVWQEIETVVATGVEIREEAGPGAEEVSVEGSFAGEMAEEEIIKELVEVKERPEPAEIIEDIEVLFEKTKAPEIPETFTEAEMLGEAIADEVLEPVAKIDEVLDLSTMSDETEAQPDQTAEPETLDINKEADTMEAGEAGTGETADGQAESTLAPVDNGDVNRWVDMAFHYKTIGDMPAAIEAFVQVWSKVESGELQYLITMELVDLYKECGYYNYAEQVLGNYLELGGHKSDIIYEINRQLNGIRFLATELTRLGMSGAPWAQVPRWIRMELEDALNQ